MQCNLALIGLRAKLQEINVLNPHSIYADDITLWVKEGSDGQIKHILRSAIDTVEQYLQGLVCSAEENLNYYYTGRNAGAVNQKS